MRGILQVYTGESRRRPGEGGGGGWLSGGDDDDGGGGGDLFWMCILAFWSRIFARTFLHIVFVCMFQLFILSSNIFHFKF